MMESKSVGLVRSNTITIIEPFLHKGFRRDNNIGGQGKFLKNGQDIVKLHGAEIAKKAVAAMLKRMRVCDAPLSKINSPLLDCLPSGGPEGAVPVLV
jgi:hypothetical protein